MAISLSLFANPSQSRSPRSSRLQFLSKHLVGVASLRSNLSFAVCQPFTIEIATFLAMTGLRRAQRGNLSFRCLPSLHNRDRFVPRDDISFCQSPLWGLRAWRGNLSFAVCQPFTTEIATFLATTGRFVKAPSGCCERSAIDSCHCERSAAISSLSKPPLGVARLRSNLSFGCLSALHNRDRHVPRDDMITLR